jgi:hypothetical protein
MLYPNDIRDNLTKENFWNDLYEKYPGQMQMFCEWIDEYKKRIGWNDLFSMRNWSVIDDSPAESEDLKTHKRGEIEVNTYKFHHLPIGMQIGIFIQYTIEIGQRYQMLEESGTIDEIIEMISEYLCQNDAYDRSQEDF